MKKSWTRTLVALSMLVATRADAQSTSKCNAAPDLPIPGKWTPGKIIDAQCNATGIKGLPTAVRSGTAITPNVFGPNAEIKFTDPTTQFECEVWIDGKTHAGLFKSRTTCGVGWSYIDRDGGGHYACQEQVPLTYRADCEANIKMTLSEVRADNGDPMWPSSPTIIRPSSGTRVVRLLVIGNDVASATHFSAKSNPPDSTTSPVVIPIVSVSGPNLNAPTARGTCAGTGCIMVEVTLPSTLPLQSKLYVELESNSRSKVHFDLVVVDPKPGAQVNPQSRAGSGGGTQPSATPTPSRPLVVTDSRTASKRCGAGGLTVSPAPAFTTRTTQSLAVNVTFDTMSPCWCPSSPTGCTVVGARSWSVVRKSDHMAVSIPWVVGSSTVPSLPPGDWEISIADASVPPGFFTVTYTP